LYILASQSSQAHSARELNEVKSERAGLFVRRTTCD